MDQVVAPLPTRALDLSSKIDHFTLILYPFVEGRSGWGAGLSDSQWVAFGAALKKLHTMRLPPDLLNRIPTETFVPRQKWMAIVEQLHAAVGDQIYDNPFEKQLAAFLRSRSPTPL